MVKNKIVLFPFPFDDFSSTKVRPVICLTNEIGIYEHIVVAFITSNIDNKNDNLDIILEKSDLEFNKTGLSVDSIIKLHKLVTIPKKLIKRQLGKLPDKFDETLKNKLKELFEL